MAPEKASLGTAGLVGGISHHCRKKHEDFHLFLSKGAKGLSMGIGHQTFISDLLKSGTWLDHHHRILV